MEKIINKLSEYQLVPVVTINDAGKAVKLAETLKTSKLPLIEVTFRTEAAEESIRLIREKHPDMCIGAGTILSVEQVKTAQKAGADFIVAPGFNPKVVDYCIENNIPIIPGVDSPSLIEAALEKGLSLVKFFPAEQSGGIDYLKAIASPYNGIKFMPTGGISQDNIMQYLAWEKIVACGGSWIAPSSLLAEDNFVEISQRVTTALDMIHG